MRPRYSPRAHADLAEIHDYIAAHNPKAATAVIRAIKSTAELVGRHPGLGRATDIAEVRMLPVVRYPYLVYFENPGSIVSILHVLHSARAAPRVGDLEPGKPD